MRETHHCHFLVLLYPPPAVEALADFVYRQHKLRLQETDTSARQFIKKSEQPTCNAPASLIPPRCPSRSSTAASAARLNHLNPLFSLFSQPHPWRSVRPHMSIPTPHPPSCVALSSKHLADSARRFARWCVMPSWRYSWAVWVEPGVRAAAEGVDGLAVVWELGCKGEDGEG